MIVMRGGWIGTGRACAWATELTAIAATIARAIIALVIGCSFLLVSTEPFTGDTSGGHPA